jgi:L-fuconate dehydratase
MKKQMDAYITCLHLCVRCHSFSGAVQDDILGHKAVREAMKPYGIGVATGEHCQNRIMFKQLITGGAIDFCQIDSCRLGGVNEVMAVQLMAAKYGIPVCPHAGGVGLCEYVQHLSIIDYVCISTSLKDRVLEFVDHLHEHFVDPVVMRNGRYIAPQAAGYSITMFPKSIADHEFPTGAVWIEELKERSAKAAKDGTNKPFLRDW